MEHLHYAGVSSDRLDQLKNADIRRKSHRIGYNYIDNHDKLYDIIHNCANVNENREEIFGPYETKKSNADNKMAGLESELINDLNIRNRRNKCAITNFHNETNIKDIIQNTPYKETDSPYRNRVSHEGRFLGMKRNLTRYISDEEMTKCFSTNYAVTDKNSGRTEIMVQRKPGCSNIIVQNFSTFDAYATFRDEKKGYNHQDSVTHTIMGIVPKEGHEQSNKRNKGETVYSDVLRSDNIVAENYWLCPSEKSEKRHFR